MAPKRRLLVATSTLPRFAGDPEPRFVLDLSKHLAPYFDVTVLAPAAPEAALEEELEGVRVVRYRYAPLRSMERLAYPGAILARLRHRPAYWLLVPLMLLGLAHAMRQQAKRGRIDVVQCHWLVPQAVVAALALRRNAPPFVITCHGSDLYGLNQRWLKALKRFALRRAAAVTTVSEPLKGEIRSLMGESEWPERTAVVSMGVDTERFAPSRRNPDWAPSKALGRPVVLFVGRLVEGKGVSFLIQALGNPVLAQTTVCAAIVGDGPQRQALEEQARYSGLGERIRFLGSVAHDALPEIYASCDIFCLPAIRTARGEEEGFGLVLAEAASSGLPIVAARVRGAQGLLEDGVTGSMVAERDPVALAKALSALASDAGLAARFGANARQQALKYDWQAIARRYRDLLACPCEM